MTDVWPFPFNYSTWHHAILLPGMYDCTLRPWFGDEVLGVFLVRYFGSEWVYSGPVSVRASLHGLVAFAFSLVVRMLPGWHILCVVRARDAPTFFVCLSTPSFTRCCRVLHVFIPTLPSTKNKKLQQYSSTKQKYYKTKQEKNETKNKTLKSTVQQWSKGGGASQRSSCTRRRT